MRIDFECSGGFANLQLAYHVDTDTLPQEKAEELLKLVKSAGVFDIQQRDIAARGAGGPPAVFSYHLSLSDGTSFITALAGALAKARIGAETERYMILSDP